MTDLEALDYFNSLVASDKAKLEQAKSTLESMKSITQVSADVVVRLKPTGSIIVNATLEDLIAAQQAEVDKLQFQYDGWLRYRTALADTLAGLWVPHDLPTVTP